MPSTVKSTGGYLTRAVNLTATGGFCVFVSYRIDDTPANGVYRTGIGVASSLPGSIFNIYQLPSDDLDFPNQHVLEYKTGDFPGTNTNFDIPIGSSIGLSGKWVHLCWTKNAAGDQHIYALTEGFDPISPSFLLSPTAVGNVAGSLSLPDSLNPWVDYATNTSEIGTNIILGRVIAASVEVTQAQAITQFQQRAPTSVITAVNYTYLSMTDASAPEVELGTTGVNFSKTGSFSTFASEPSEWMPPPPPPTGSPDVYYPPNNQIFGMNF